LGRDIPIAMIPMYHWSLQVPHADKKEMEEVLDGCDRDWIAIRPSFLTDGAGTGVDSLRLSVEGEGNAAIGYTVSRADVAAWILEKCVVEGEETWAKWGGKKVTLTY
jgi:hypothetical protein